ncbi:MAG: hypothetical protein O8C61_01525 [Candidatus Methanoperedens sp.]|nr:hypothetical protein [Candidatus Methanoperedens sp.]
MNYDEIFSIFKIDIKNILDNSSLIVSLVVIIVGGLWSYYKWKYEQKRMRDEEGQYDPRFNMFIQIKKHKGRTDETKLVEIRGLLKNIGRIPIKVNYGKSFINIYKIPDEYKDPIDSAFFKPFRTIYFTKISDISDVVILDNGITYPTPTTIHDLPKKGNFYFNIIFDIGDHKKTFSRLAAFHADGKEVTSLVYNITLLLTEEDSEVSQSSLE